jgi:hypothetical protein
MNDSDYKRFLNFLRKYQCQLPFQSFRVVGADKAETGSGDQDTPPAYVSRRSS